MKPNGKHGQREGTAWLGHRVSKRRAKSSFAHPLTSDSPLFTLKPISKEDPSCQEEMGDEEGRSPTSLNNSSDALTLRLTFSPPTPLVL